MAKEAADTPQGRREQAEKVVRSRKRSAKLRPSNRRKPKLAG
jgi:hypothetical protein